MAATLGTLQTVVVCIPGTGTQGWGCPEGMTQSVTQAYLLAPSEAYRFDVLAEPFSPSIAGEYFGFAFASTFFVYLVSFSLGSLISFVRRF